MVASGASTAASEQHDRKALEALIVDNVDLEKLESLVAEFNIFEALGAVRQELRHSSLLAFLLDPSDAHGLGASFLRRLLQRTLANSQSGQTTLTPVDIDVLELDDAEVSREHANIDILVVDARNKLAVIVENKIDSGEHSDQLRRYWASVDREFSDYRVVGLYLTPDGDTPSDERYFAVDYGLIADLVGDILDAPSSTIGPDVRMLLRHYQQMLGRHIVSESEIAELCRKLYRKHKHALDLIYQHRPDPRQGAVRDLAEKLLGEQPDLLKDDSTKTFLRFCPKQWDVPQLREGGGWTKSGRMLLFEFVFLPDRVVLKLSLGPGPDATRQAVFKVAHGHPSLFKGSAKTLSPKWHQIFQRSLLDPRILESEDSDLIEVTLREHWLVFITNELPALSTALKTNTGLGLL